METFDPQSSESHLSTRSPADDPDHATSPRFRRPGWMTSRRIALGTIAMFLLALVLTPIIYFGARQWVRAAVHNSLPQIDGRLPIPGLTAAVTVQRDAHGVPHIRAASVDDLVLAQGFVTASDRLFQMDTLRRHAAGELAAVLGPSVVGHDRLQRTLQIRAAADRALAQLAPTQRHMLDQYAAGVNAAMAVQAPHLPIEFRVLRYTPEPWTARDCLLVQLVLFQDLTNTFPAKLAREALVARLPAEQRASLEQDLYPVGSWRDHPPATPVPDLSIPGPPFEAVPLDESQSSLTLPARHAEPSLTSILAMIQPWISVAADEPSELMPGSNTWVVSGAHTASGKPLLSNDMHLAHTLPGIWYESDLGTTGGAGLHVAGVTVPGIPLIVVGHNDHIAWGFANLGADVQDVYVESLRGAGAAQEFLATDGSWQPVVHLHESIAVRGDRTIALDIAGTHHGDVVTPILNPALSADASAPGGVARTLSLRWTLYDPAAVSIPSQEIAEAHDWPTFLAAFRSYGGPSVSVMYADDQNHIGFHAIGMIPTRGAMPAASAVSLPADLAANDAPASEPNQSPGLAANPDPLNATAIQAPAAPAVATNLHAAPTLPAAASEWTGYIPFDDLPQVFDPAGGVIAAANARVTPDGYRYPVTLNWGAPYRNERIWHLLGHRTGLRAEDMLPIQMDVYSDFDHVLAQRLAYALDHVPKSTKKLHEAADLLRTFNGRMTTDSPAAALVAAVHGALWPMLLAPKLQPAAGSKIKAPTVDDINKLYVWGERDDALEQILMHAPPRWLPHNYATWNDLLAAAVLRGLADARAPDDLAKWRYGTAHTVEIEHPIFDRSDALRHLLGLPTGTGAQPQSGDGTTIKQAGHTFGPSQRFTADLADLDHSTMNVVLGQSENPASPWFMDQFTAWYHGTTFALPYTDAALAHATTHTLTLTPR